ncbi:Anaphase-promoting complex subunit 1 [Balamuthia mandrillaris]
MMELKAARAAYTPFSVAELPFRSVTPFQPFGRRLAEEEEGEEAHGSELEACRSCYLLAPSTAVAAAGAQLHQEGLTESEVYAYCSGGDAATASTKIVWSSGGRVINTWEVGGAAAAISSFSSPSSARQHQPSRTLSWASFPSSLASSGLPDSFSFSSSSSSSFNSIGSTWWKEAVGGGALRQQRRRRYLCVLQAVARTLTLCETNEGMESTSGSSDKVQHIPLPFLASSLWRLPLGLLVQRAVSSSSSFSNSEFPTAEQITAEAVPGLFSLLHPLEELRPVPTTTSPSSSDVGTIIYSSERWPLIVSHHQQHHQNHQSPTECEMEGHSLWILLPAQQSHQPTYTTAINSKKAERDFGLSNSSADPVLEPQLALHRLFVAGQGEGGKEPKGKASSVFIMPDDGQSDENHMKGLLCLLIPTLSHHLRGGHQSNKAEEGASSILEVYSFSITLSPSSSLPSSKYSSVPSAVAVPQCLVKKVHSQAALAAMPIERRASNSSSDLVILHTNGSIGVYRQLKLLFHCSFCVPSPLSMPPAPVVGLCDAIGSRLNLLLGDRNQTRLRVTVPEVASSPLVLRCLAFLCSAMHQEDAFTLLRLYLCHNQQHNNVASSLPAEITDGEEEVEWRSLCHVLHFIFERQATEPYHSPAPQQLSSSIGSDHSDDDDGDDDWQYLLGSNVHQRHSTSFSALDKHCTIPNVTRSHSSSSSPSTSSYSLLEEEWNSKVVLFSTSCSTILFALHSIYEESKLNILHSSYVQRLGTLLMELAQRLAWLNYLEHYRRDLGLNVVDGEGAACTSCSLASCEEEPASIYSWLHRRLRGEIGLKPFTFAIQPYEQGEATAVPLVDASRVGDTQLTRKVCLFYDILCGGDGHHYANAHPNNRGKGETKEEKEKRKEESTAPASKPVVSYNKPSERWQRVVLSMAHEGFTLEQLNNLPFGVAVPLRDAIQQCRAGNIPTGWPVAAYHLLGRNDLAPGFNASLVEQLPSPHDAQGSDDTILENTGISFSTGRNRPATTATGSAAPTTSGEQDMMGKRNEWDGLGAILDNEACRLRFGRDQRLRDVHKMLASSYPRRIHLQANQAAGAMGMAEHEIAAAQQKQLLRMAHRTLALAVGRGMFTLSSTSSHLLVEPLPIPLIVLDGKAGERGKTLTVTLEAGSVPPEVLRWPEFHNGVATALRIAPSYQVADMDDDELASSAGAGFWDQRQVTSTWIVYNKQLQAAAGGGSDNNMSNGHAGLLMGLGLQGHLSSLSQTKVFDYLSKGHELTSVGILLGMAASKIGTMEASLAKLLSIHVPALHPPSSSDLEVPPSVQTASLLALGLLYQGTLHRHMCEILLQEIGRSPLAKPHPDHGGSSSGAEREGLALAAGLALGLVGLAQGGNGATMKPAGLSDMCIEDTLFYYMEGGRQGGNTKRPLSTASSLDGGGVSALHDWLAPDADDTAATEDSVTMMITGNGASDRSLHGNSNNSKNSLVLLSSRRPVDVDATAAGAILALALLFLKTEHRVVAQRLAPPTTPYLLDGIRPDLLLLRVLARNLVLWHSIQPNKGWMDSQMPQVVLRFAAKEDAKRTRGPIFVEEQDDDEDVTSSSNYAYADTLRQAHINILAGACLSLGLRFAGSSDGAAYALLLEQVEYMQKRLRVAPEQDYPMVETCLNMATLSLSLVMAGTGHLPTLRLLRSQHRRVRPRHPHNRSQRQEENLTDLFSRNGSREAVSYGTHMATNMALGLLFLGGGRYSLGTQNHQIAALVCALYPRFPLDCQDNRYHLQAFRHLYVLACEERCVQAVDVETRQQCYVPIRVDLMTSSARKGSSLDLTAPCLLPEFRFIQRMSIASPRYWSYNIVLAPSPGDDDTRHSSAQAKTLLRHRIIFVKRKTGFLSYSQDPAGLRSILCRPFPQYQHHLQNPACHLFQQKQRPSAMSAAWKQQNRLLFIKSFSQDPNILAFANHFALPQSCANPTGASTSPFTQLHNEEAANFLASFCTAALYECLTQEKPEVLQTYLHLYRIIQQLRNYSAICSASSPSGHLAEREVAALTQSLLNVKIILAYYSSSASSSSFASDTYNDDLPATASSPAPLLQAIMLAELQDSVNSFFDELHFCLPTSHAAALHPLSPSSQLPQAHNPTPLQQYILSFLMKDEATPISSSTTTQRLFGCFLQYYDIPYPPSLISNFAIPSSSSSARRGVSMLRLARLLPHSPPHVLATILLALRPKTPLQ